MPTKIYKKDNYMVVGSSYYPINSLRFRPNLDKTEVEIFELSDINPFIKILFSDIRTEANVAYTNFDTFINSIFAIPGTPINDGEYYTILQPTIDINHKRIHEGNMFYYQKAIADLDNAAVFEVLLKTGAKEVHFGYDLLYMGKIQFDIFEVTDRSETTALPILNKNRDSINTPLSTMSVPSAGGSSTVNICPIISGFSQGTSVRLAIPVGSSSERILKKNNKYIIRITSLTDNQSISLRYEFYEE